MSASSDHRPAAAAGRPDMPRAVAKHRNATVDILRGIAAVMVCFCHFRYAFPSVWRDELETYGELGVQVFFVISGFIIPFSLIKGNYRVRDFGRFWLKRLIRLHPTYLVALGFTFVASHAVAVVRSSAAPFTWMELFKGSFYLHIPEENPVFWTLIVELKYYLFISLLFPLLFARSEWGRRVSFALAIGAAAAGHAHFDLLHHLPYFLLGFCGCYLATARASRLECTAWAIVVLSLGAAVGSTLPQLLAGAVALVVIVYRPFRNWRVGVFLGAISYSLYVIHFPFGVKLLNLLLPHAPAWLDPVVGLVVFGASLGIAYLLARAIEEPSAEWSQAIKLSGLRGSGLRVRLHQKRAEFRERWRSRGRFVASLLRPTRVFGARSPS
ncbi:MAG: acyltransferase [Opitutus sp.]|nr:acyltransferase [Opitutus sp.]